MTSSSPRKRRTTGSSEPTRRATLLVALLALVLGASACRRSVHDPFVTYFNGEFRLSMRYPASWRSEQAAQEGVWYRYFLGPAPATGAQRKPAVSATLLVGPLNGSIEEYAQTYLEGNTMSATHDDRRPGLAGKSFVFATPDGATRYSLLLLRQEPLPAGAAARVFGLYCQGDAASFGQYAPVLTEMATSLNVERVEDWPEVRIRQARLSLRVPTSWQHLRRTSSGRVLLEQFTSPTLAVDKGAQTVHASLTVSVEAAPKGLDEYYAAVKRQLGPNFGIVTHQKWKDGYVDVLHIETPMASSYIKRFYRVSGGQGCSLIFEARSDTYQRVAAWFDLIADTLRFNSETGARRSASRPPETPRRTG
jgi:hypothetical protein